MIGLNFGRESDWFKNIQAAGGCRMRLGNEQLKLGASRLVTLKAGSAGMPWYFGLALKYVIRTRDCVELPITSSTQVHGPARPLPQLAVVTACVGTAVLAVRLLRRSRGS